MSKMYKYTGILPARRINIHHNSVILVYLSPRGSPAANTWVLRGLCMCLTVSRLCHILLPNPLSGYAKEPFPHCETGFPAGRKSLSCNVEKAFINDNDVYIIGLQHITRIAKYCAICIRTDTQPQINGSRGVEVGQIYGFVGIAHKKGVYLFYNSACLK